MTHAFPTRRSSDLLARGEPTLDIGDDVHDVAVELDGVLLGHLHAADRGDAADVVAAEIEQHEVLGELLRVAQQILGKRSEEHTSELQSLMRISYAVFCLKKKTTRQ